MAFEGNDTERIYFEEFKESDRFNEKLICLHLLKRPKNDTNSAPNHVFNKLKREAKDKYNFGKDDELWMIIDTDKWKNIPQITQECHKLGNMFVAVSNPCFEFWLLLHIKDLQDYTEDELSEILENNKTSKRSRNYIEKKLIEILGSYNKTNPKPERFIPHIDKAIKQAKALDNKQEDFPSGLGSHIYKLVEKISIGSNPVR